MHAGLYRDGRWVTGEDSDAEPCWVALATAGAAAGRARVCERRSREAVRPRVLPRGPGGAGSLRQPDSLPHPHLPAGTDTLPAIEHVVILMMENHSFDDHFGRLGRGDGLKVAVTARRSTTTRHRDGGYILSYPMPNTAVPEDSKIGQDWNASHLCWDDGTNMGFARTCGPASMGHFTRRNSPSTTRSPRSSRSATATSARSWHRPTPTGGF